MLNKYLFVFLFVISFFKTQAQQDSIVNYISSKGKIVPESKAIYYEIIIKQTDSLWLVDRYWAGLNRLKSKSFFTSSNKELKIGKETNYSRFGKILNEKFFDNKGGKIGTQTTWFDNGKIDYIGSYKDGLQEGEWNFYHYNGKLALQKFYHKGKLISKIYYSEKGKVLPKSTIIIDKEDRVFKGGKKRYLEKLNELKKEIDFRFRASISVRYTIGVDGRIYDVTVDEVLPEKLKTTIIDFFENLKGWKPRVHYNRKIPSVFNQRINYK